MRDEGEGTENKSQQMAAMGSVHLGTVAAQDVFKPGEGARHRILCALKAHVVVQHQNQTVNFKQQLVRVGIGVQMAGGLCLLNCPAATRRARC